eukprot:CAMPEP_0175284866 /NCGR_PEP_ID=MMETSP0093-20121207/52929_1 /TAXON_ID=311494 /ORGANISM="Alexandrium monilatum, Strain CCMP3105" /LENGTH=99 /DNA_ID=CAMNT_0016580235 /DNA_START=118 /DNA_END=417 /DNA_ORIENTATION=-
MSMGTPVREFKGKIMNENWPDSLVAIENVERIRVFTNGREFGGKADDNKSLKDVKLKVCEDYPTPVHVQWVLKDQGPAGESETGTTKPQGSQGCNCTLL